MQENAKVFSALVATFLHTPDWFFIYLWHPLNFEGINFLK